MLVQVLSENGSGHMDINPALDRLMDQLSVGKITKTDQSSSIKRIDGF